MSKILYLNFFKLFIVLSFGFRYKRIIQNMRFCLFASAFWSIQIKKINFGQLAENPLEGLVSIIIAKSAFLIQIALDLVQDTQAYEISMNSGHFSEKWNAICIENCSNHGAPIEQQIYIQLLGTSGTFYILPGHIHETIITLSNTRS